MSIYRAFTYLEESISIHKLSFKHEIDFKIHYLGKNILNEMYFVKRCGFFLK